jgi:hypothetical protein
MPPKPARQFSAELEGDSVLALSPEQLAALLRESLPNVNTEHKEELKDLIHSRCIEHGIDGKQLVEMFQESSVPGSRMETHHVFKQLFDGTDGTFRRAITVVRGGKVFATMVINKLILANASAAINAVEQQVFGPKMIPSEYRLRAFDAWYAPDQLWCIEAGEQRHEVYNSEVCRAGEGVSAVHGFYIAPAGWMRFALDTPKFRPETSPEEWSTWHKAYHGTAGVNVPAIVQQGLRFKPSQHGSAGKAGGKSVIYASPSIEYSSHYVYTDETVMNFDDGAGGGEIDWSEISQAHYAEGSFVQWVFEVRVRPGSYRVQGNTLGSNLWGEDGKHKWDIEYDSLFNSRNLEWLIENEDDIICTAVMMRDIPQRPSEYNRSRFEAMKEHVGWDDALQAATRPRDYGGVTAGAVRWEYNNEPSDGSTLSYSGSLIWVAYAEEISKVAEDAYQAYQRFAFVGRPEGAPGPYFIDFGSECDPKLDCLPEQRRADGDKGQAWRRRAVRRVPVD